MLSPIPFSAHARSQTASSPPRTTAKSPPRSSGGPLSLKLSRSRSPPDSSTMPGLNLDPASPTAYRSASFKRPGGSGSGARANLKQDTFVCKHGLRHHSFDPEKAPYPVCYDRHVLELQSMDRAMVSRLKRSVSFIDFKDDPPQRSLDLGCGTGAWVIDAAKEWPECHFVGFDLVNVQIPVKFLDKTIAERIKWVHGNFLTTKLPFEDDEFDHVHIASIARGVPENKWNTLFEEVNRILRPGGSVEISEHDILFPTLPRWFTTPLRVRSQRSASIHLPDGPSPSTPPPAQNQPPHDHALLESLFYSVFKTRFISTRPTAVLPIYFTAYFRQVLSSPVVNFPMPPLAPLPPLPRQSIPPDPLTARLEMSEGGPTSTLYTTRTHSDSVSIPARTHSASPSFSSSFSASTLTSLTDSLNTSIFSASNLTTNSTSLTVASDMADRSSIKRVASSSSFVAETSSPGPSPTSDKKSAENTPTPTPTPTVHRFIIGNSASDSTSIGFSHAQLLLNLDDVAQLGERTLAMHLYYAYQSVLACQESMWEELKDRLINRKDELLAFGWEDDEELEELQNRMKFERLVERYRTDMQARVSLWCSLADLGWPLPPRDPLSKAEHIEEERIHEAMLEGRKHATEEDMQALSRSMRVMVGFKSS